MDLWVEPTEENLERANLALSDFGSPLLLSTDDSAETAQIGAAPNRIDLDSLLRVKEAIEAPRHREDARVLREVKRMRERKETRE